MANVKTFTAKSVDEALAQAAEALGVSRDELNYVVVAEAKKGLFGIGSQDAVIDVTVEESPDQLAFEFVKKILVDLSAA